MQTLINLLKLLAIFAVIGVGGYLWEKTFPPAPREPYDPYPWKKDDE